MKTTGRRIAILAGMLAVAVLGLASVLFTAQPPAAKVRLEVRVDPRVELFSVIFSLAGNSEYGSCRLEAYRKDAEARFAAQRSHPAVELARKLGKEAFIGYDAPMSLAVHLSDPPDLKERVPFDPRPETLEARWTAPAARDFEEKARAFYRDARFPEFLKKNVALHRTAASRLEALLLRQGHLEWLEESFGARPKLSFKVVPALLNGPQCYGVRFRAGSGAEEAYCLMGVWKSDTTGLPVFDATMLPTVIHEFAHSFVNPVVEAHAKELQAAGEALYTRVAPAMLEQAYGNWKIVVCESVVRATAARWCKQFGGVGAYKAALAEENKRSFPWTGDLADLLSRLEKDKKGGLDALVPEVAALFEAWAKKLPSPGEASPDAPHVVSTEPGNGAEGIDPSMTAIRIVFDRLMEDDSWSVMGGGPHFPQITGKISYDRTQKVLTLPVKLKPEWTYEFGLNGPGFEGFRSKEGVPLAPVGVTFKTGRAR